MQPISRLPFLAPHFFSTSKGETAVFPRIATLEFHLLGSLALKPLVFSHPTHDTPEARRPRPERIRPALLMSLAPKTTRRTAPSRMTLGGIVPSGIFRGYVTLARTRLARPFNGQISHGLPHKAPLGSASPSSFKPIFHTIDQPQADRDQGVQRPRRPRVMPERVSHGQQNAYRCLPSGRDPGGGSAW